MTIYVPDWNVVVDPEQTETLPDGNICQEVTLVLVDETDEQPQRRRPVAVTLAPAQARKVAARLMAAAAQAEHEPPSRVEE